MRYLPFSHNACLGALHLLALVVTPANLFSVTQYHQSVIDNARQAEKVMAGRQLAIALDTVRTKPCAGELFPKLPLVLRDY
jgi:hypothetical protein